MHLFIPLRPGLSLVLGENIGPCALVDEDFSIVRAAHFDLVSLHGPSPFAAHLFPFSYNGRAAAPSVVSLCQPAMRGVV